MQIPREVDYGIRAVVVMAANEGRLLQKRVIAERFAIPLNFLAIILPKLVRCGIAESLPGPRGGYRLAKDASKISVLDVIRAICGGIELNRCGNGTPRCDQRARCPVSPHWKRLCGEIESYLGSVMFDDLASGFGR